MIDKNLLIIGAGVYGEVALEIATDMACFDKIDFIDDEKQFSPNGKQVVGTVSQIGELADRYGNIIVAIGNSEKRLSLLEQIKETSYCIAKLVSPFAYVSPSAQIKDGTIVEPAAVIHTGCMISEGCIISAGAVINHHCNCLEGVHVDCNATVNKESTVPKGKKVFSGEVFDSK